MTTGATTTAEVAATTAREPPVAVDIMAPTVLTIATAAELPLPGAKTAPISKTGSIAEPGDPPLPKPPGLHPDTGVPDTDQEVEDLVNKHQPRPTYYEYRRFNLRLHL